MEQRRDGITPKIETPGMSCSIANKLLRGSNVFLDVGRSGCEADFSRVIE